MSVKITRPDSPVTITMDLSYREAMLLRSIMRNIGGMARGPRGLADEIEGALREEGIYYYDPTLSGFSGSLILPNDWNDLVPNGDED